MELAARNRIERTKRFVEEYETRFRCDTPRKSDTLTLAPR
jgi:hypothetical protein